ncbi:MAG: hypothetical protein M1536_00550 [Firmicutes bacterium]|nr:hypothetical protein [Bacillota bacterium]
MRKLLFLPLILLLVFLAASAGLTDSRSKTIAGKITGIFTETAAPYLTIQSGGENINKFVLRQETPQQGCGVLNRKIKISISKNCRIFYGEKEAFSPYILAEGDIVKILLNKDGKAEKICDNFELLSGLIFYFDSRELLLETGQILECSHSSAFYLNGVKTSAGNIKKGMRCWARVDAKSWTILRADIYSGGEESADAAGSKNSGEASLTTHLESPEKSEILDAGRLPAMPLKAGEKLDLFIKAKPLCSASVQIPGITGKIPLKELGGGIYKTQLKTGSGPDLKNGIILFTLSDKKNTWTKMLSPLSIAISPPEISQFSPADNTIINSSTPSIFAVYDSKGALIDTEGVRLWVNGKEVTYKCQRTVSMIFYLPEEPLPPGKVKIKLRLKDQAGNITEKEWNFTIKGSRSINYLSIV